MLMNTPEPILCPAISTTMSCSIPLCRSCLRGKGKVRSLHSSKVTPNKDHTDVIKQGHLQPGDCVSTDQFECRIKGRLPSSRGKEDPDKMYSGGTIFVDHATGLIDIYIIKYLLDLVTLFEVRNYMKLKLLSPAL